MSGKIPSSRDPSKKSQFENFKINIETFLWEEVSDRGVLRSGSYGCVLSGRRANGEMVKKLLRQNDVEDQRLFFKEARILN